MSHDDKVKALATAVGQQIKAGRGTAYTQTTVKAGDTLSATATTEQTFASQYVIPAGTLAVGDTITIQGGGVFTSSAVVAPTQRPRIKLNGITVIDTGALMLLLGATNARYRFTALLTVRAIGTNGAIEASANLFFNNATSGQSVIYTAGPTAGASETGNPVTVNTTGSIPITMSTTYSTVTAGNSNTLRQLTVTISKAGSAST